VLKDGWRLHPLDLLGQPGYPLKASAVGNQQREISAKCRV
jgi:hypothetical protein